MPGYGERRAAFMSLCRSYVLCIEAGLPSAPLYDVLNGAVAALLDSIEALEVDVHQKMALQSEVWDELRDLP